ncbi:AAA family ATPase [Bradyrhizobium sp. HKCCYLS2038]|uniref:AAA family ATPase n=1 Tax=unclassified Bradyrhizobium TaxID=2631580 RepID=UPI003EBE0FB0
MNHPVHLRPSEGQPIDRAAPIGSAEHGRRLLGAITASAVAPPEAELLSDALASATQDALGAAPSGEPLQDVLGCLTDIIRAASGPAERRDPYAIDSQSFALDQQELEGLPGVVLNTFDVDGPVWLAVEALVATEPPAFDPDLDAWLEPSSDPDRRPLPRETMQVTVSEIEKNRLTFARHARPEDFSPAPSADAPGGTWTGRLRLEQRADLVQRIERYVAGPWTAWADTERARRRTMAIHRQLRELAAVVRTDPAKEIMWGITLSSWRKGGRESELPLFERPVEIEILERPDAEVRLRPRFTGAVVNLRALEALAPDAAPSWHDKSEPLVEALEQHGELSPFTALTLEQILRAVGGQPGQRSVAACEGAEAVETADAAIAGRRWVMSARRRPESLALRDIECLKSAIEHAPQSECSLTGAVSALLPQTGGRGHSSSRRHLSSVVGAPINIGPAAKPVVLDIGDLFFPLPASSEHIEVVRELSRSDGLVVQAASQDARVQTLVNVVCHHLALGSRVLVVSRDETALALLHQKLPAGIRELAASSTGADKDVLKKAEAAADRLQGIVDTTNLRELADQIGRLERDIISKRTQMASLDGEIADIVGRNVQLSGGRHELPLDLIKGLLTDQDPPAWFSDRPACLLSNTDAMVMAVEKAREARLRLAEHLAHIDAELPATATLPDAAAMLRLHEELRQQAGASSEDNRDEDLALDAIAMFGLDATTRLAADLDALVAAHHAIANDAWLARLSPLGAAKSDVSVGNDKVVGWARDASFQLSRSAEFAKRQVHAPVEAFNKKDAIRVVERLAAGEKAMPRFSPSRRALKAAIEAITVDGAAPATPADWQYVHRFLNWRHDLLALRTRWTAIATRIGAPAIELESARAFDDIERIVKSVEAAVVMAALAVRNVVDACRKLSMPDTEVTAMLSDAQRPKALGAAIRSVMTRVSGPLSQLARVGELFAGAVELAATVQSDILSRIGDADVEPREIETRWSGVLATVEAIARADDDYRIVRSASQMLLEAGAPDIAQRVRNEPATAGAGDPVLLPDWVTAWNAAALMRIDGHDERQLLHDLAAQRLRLEQRSLALFEAVISARMTLAIAQNASTSVRQSLKRFRDTMQKMVSACSSPTARRLRVAVRKSLDGWFEEIPCHVMPAWRVAELLPARIGSFDLVVIDQASRSDLRELTAMLRARKVVVSDSRREIGAEVGQEDTGRRADQKNLRGVLPAFRRLMLPNASLRDLAEILFPDRFIDVRTQAGDVSRLPAVAENRAVAPVAQPRAASAGTKRRGSAKATTHTIEEEIATVAKYLSLARRSGGEIPMQPRVDRHEGAEASDEMSPKALNKTLSKTSAKTSPTAPLTTPPDVRLLRRRPAAVTPPAPVTSSSFTELPPQALVALPPQAPLEGPSAALPPPLPQPAVLSSAVASDAPAAVDQRDATAPLPAEIADVKATTTISSATTAAAEPAKPGAVADETKIHPSLVEMAFKSAESGREKSRRLPSRRIMAVAAVGLLAVVGAAVSWQRAADFMQIAQTSAAMDSALPSEPGARKINAERIVPDGKEVAANETAGTVGQSSAPATVAPVTASAQAFLYHEDPQEPKGKRFTGKVVWSLEPSKGPRLNAAPSLKGEIEIENGMKVTMSLRRNADLELPASHVMELSFAWPDPAIGLTSLRGIGLKGEEAERGTALATQTARVTPKVFMIALSANEVDTKRNVLLLRGKQWFDIPIVYEGGNRALLSIEKGPEGDRLFNEAFTSWGQ